jgi:hypothetical protein
MRQYHSQYEQSCAQLIEIIPVVRLYRTEPILRQPAADKGLSDLSHRLRWSFISILCFYDDLHGRPFFVEFDDAIYTFQKQPDTGLSENNERTLHPPFLPLHPEPMKLFLQT